MAEYPETMPTQARGPLGLGEVPNKQFDTVLMGRRTYEPALALGVTSPYAHLRQYVFSRSLTSTDPDVEMVAGDPAGLVRDLKGQDGAGIWLCGGGQLASQLLHEIDELVIKRNPIVLGSGVPLFDGPFEPVSSRRFDTGVVMATYRKP